MLVEVPAVGPAGQQLPHEMGQHHVIGPGPNRQVAGGQAGGLGPERIHDPQPGPVGHLTQPGDRVGEGAGMAMGHDRVGADEKEEAGPVHVEIGQERSVSTHELGDIRAGHAIDRQGRVDAR